jgi:hypothetical protein
VKRKNEIVSDELTKEEKEAEADRVLKDELLRYHCGDQPKWKMAQRSTHDLLADAFSKNTGMNKSEVQKISKGQLAELFSKTQKSQMKPMLAITGVWTSMFTMLGLTPAPGETGLNLEGGLAGLSIGATLSSFFVAVALGPFIKNRKAAKEAKGILEAPHQANSPPKLLTDMTNKHA